ncbi:MAG TPA: hypothetical protein VGT08_12215 [Terracidiphilus sp.]|nr:hypothetical protein [Terracidiphilus sp.]
MLNKARFWDRFAATELNERQRDMINRLLNGFEGQLTSSKWAKIEKCSQDTALRDIEDLIQKSILKKGICRRTEYVLFTCEDELTDFEGSDRLLKAG